MVIRTMVAYSMSDGGMSRVRPISIMHVRCQRAGSCVVAHVGQRKQEKVLTAGGCCRV